MRTASCLTLSLLVGSWFTLAHAQPYVAEVAGPEATVRSGPGTQYYSTQKLAEGTKVNVYRQDPGGWAAISPPEGSFSWVLGKYVQIDRDETATINAAEVNARVGSKFSDIRDVIQVRLSEGQQVYVLDAKLLRVGQSAQTWYKIEPPPGEFRWVKLEELAQVSRKPKPSPRSETVDAPESLPPPEMPEQPPVEPEPPLAVAEENWEPRTGSQPQTVKPKTKQVQQTAFQERLPEEVDDAEPIAIAPESITPNAAEALERERKLQILSHELSRIVTEPPKTWYFDDLYDQAEAILDEAQTGHVRSLAREFLKELDHFDQVKRGYRQLRIDGYAVTEQPEPSAPRTLFASQRSEPQAPAEDRVTLPTRETAADDPRLDGLGRLAPLYSSEFGAPRYALLSEEGERQFYITPGPGLKLKKYIGQEVGVVGTVSKSLEGGVPYIVAKRVIPLSE